MIEMLQMKTKIFIISVCYSLLQYCGNEDGLNSTMIVPKILTDSLRQQKRVGCMLCDLFVLFVLGSLVSKDGRSVSESLCLHPFIHTERPVTGPCHKLLAR